MKRKTIGAFALVGLATLGSGGELVAEKMPASELTCALPQKGAFSLGWVAEVGGTQYRCLPIFDNDLKPAGAAWVEVLPITNHR